MVKVELNNITKKYGEIIGVKNLNLVIEDGDYVAILGPTGAGKTTTMYLIAGLLSPTEGTIFFDNQDITSLPAEDRDVGFVFEEYNLFPRMNVEENILFGPIVKDLNLNDSKRVANELLDMLNIAGKEKNHPDEISGGQKQRVALARAIVSNAKLLVMDDPLRALDAKIREMLQIELRKLVKDLGLTCIHATHDTHEAMRVADRIVVFRDGTIIQSGTPEEVYNKPASIYVAEFLGENVHLEGVIMKEKNNKYLVLSNKTKLLVSTTIKENTEVIALIPLELIDIYPKKQKDEIRYDNIIPGVLTDIDLIGEFYQLRIKVFGKEIKGRELIGKNISWKSNTEIIVAIDKDDFRIFPKKKET